MKWANSLGFRSLCGACPVQIGFRTGWRSAGHCAQENPCPRGSQRSGDVPCPATQPWPRVRFLPWQGAFFSVKVDCCLQAEVWNVTCSHLIGSDGEGGSCSLKPLRLSPAPAAVFLAHNGPGGKGAYPK